MASREKPSARRAKRRSDDEEDVKGDKAILQEAKDRFKRVSDWEQNFQRLYVLDTKFALGDSENGWQWPDDQRRDREANKRPALTLNFVERHVNLITNDARQNKPSISMKPANDDASFESAQIYEGLIRDIEYKSRAQDIYDDATDSQTNGGIGYWRVGQYYPDDNDSQKKYSFNQALRIDPVKNHLGVYLDPDIKQKSGLDAMWGFVFDQMPRDEFERQNPALDMEKMSQGTGIPEADDDWMTPDYIRIAEYYRIVTTDDTLWWVEDASGTTSEFLESQAVKDFKDSLVPGKFRKRKIITKQLQWFKIAGNIIIDRDEKRPGQYVPIIRCVGVERIVEGKLVRKGFVRSLKDAQRMINYNAPLSLNTPVPTPNGWTTIGDISAGDTVFDENGKPVQVLGTSPIFINRDCFKIVFDDGSKIIADSEHKWAINARGKRSSKSWNWFDTVLTTKELKPNDHFIQSPKALDLDDQDLPVHPYVFGAWLGDGSSAEPRIYSGKDDMYEMHGLLSACGYKVGEPKFHAGNMAAGVMTVYGIRHLFVQMGVLGNKHIPQQYLRSSYLQRVELLRGLMDTDGNVSKHTKTCSFITSFPQLRESFSELLRSLGLKSKIQYIASAQRKFPSGNTYTCQEAWRFSFSFSSIEPILFKLKRKIDIQKKKTAFEDIRTKRFKIISVEKVPSVPVKCIGVDSLTHLFLVGEGMIPTHNSAEVESAAMATKTKWVGSAAAFEGNEPAWNRANVDNAAYLTFNHLDSEGQPLPQQALPQRIDPAAGTPAYINGMQMAEQWLQKISGQEAAQLGQAGNEKSGKAINERQRQSDIATYLFVNNLSIAIAATGEVIKDLVPHVYDTKRVLQIMGQDGSQSKVTVDPAATQAYEAKLVEGVNQVLFNPNVGKYEVHAEVGPAYSTQRQEAFNAFTQIVTSAPELINKIGDLLFRTADFPLAIDIAERLRRDIENSAPWLLKDGVPSPAMQQMQAALQQTQGQVAELIQKLAEKNLEIKNHDEENRIKQYEAESHRLTAETNSIVDMKKMQIELGELMQTIVQTLGQMQKSGGQGETGAPVPALEDVPSGAGNIDTNNPAVGDAPPDEAEEPPEPGATKANDGNWYVERNGQRYAVMPHGGA